MTENLPFPVLLARTQEYISRRYAGALAGEEILSDGQKQQLRAYIEKYLRDSDFSVSGMDRRTLTEKLCREMAEYGLLTPYLHAPDLEEININSWDDIALTRTDGSVVKLQEHFISPGHAVDIIRRLLHHSGMIIDNASPVSLGHLPGSTRIAVLKDPIVDPERGIAASIRLVHPRRVTRQTLLDTGFATADMLAFLCLCIRCGVPFVIAGATGSGKTTLLNAVLSSVPDTQRIFTIEAGSRELELVRKNDRGETVNNVVHTLSRPSDTPSSDISQEDLVALALRFNPDIICVGEMRDAECSAAVEASLTGHTVVSTVHAGPGAAAHTRIALLCQKRFPLDFSTSLLQAGQAFPVVVYTHKLENNERKCLDITECVTDPDGNRQYRCLYRYRITENTGHGTRGSFEHPASLSDSLCRRLLQYGAREYELRPFRKEDA